MVENEVTISIATIDDATDLARLGSDTFTEAFGHLYAQEDLQAFLTEQHSYNAYRTLLSDTDVRVWIARTRAGQAVGFASAGSCHLPVPDMPPESGELIRLYVLKSHQGDGLGVRMLESVLDFLENRYKHIFLSVYSENFGAQRLYKRYGFEKIHDYYFMVGNHADEEFVMQRTHSIRP